jgi:hypothetical protein
MLAMNRVVLRISRENQARPVLAVAAGFRLTDEEPVVREPQGRKVSHLTWCRRRAT